MAAPSRRRRDSADCSSSGVDQPDSSRAARPLSNNDIMQHIRIVAEHALGEADKNLEILASKRLNYSVEKLMETWGNLPKGGDWPLADEEMRIKLEEADRTESFSKSDREEFLKDTHRYLHIMAGALNVLADVSTGVCPNAPVGSGLVDAETVSLMQATLNSTMREVTHAMVELCIECPIASPLPEVSEDTRCPKGHTNTSIRDWVVFRDFLRLMRHISAMSEMYRLKMSES